MAIRTVRLDAESERILAEVQEATGMSVSRVLKEGLVAVRDARRTGVGRRPYDIYVAIDLGPGGYARAPARASKSAIRKILEERKRR